MNYFYEEKNEKLNMIHKVSKHFPPHLHEALEMIYVTKGSLELGIEQELYHMEKGDFAIVFPNLIHHYQVFSNETSRAYYLFPHLSICGQFRDELLKSKPVNPVIKKEDVHPDILNTIKRLEKDKLTDEIVIQAYIQIIIARSMPYFRLISNNTSTNEDLIYQVVTYMAKHFKEELTLDIVAKELGVSKYVVSRVFSTTFHKNFNQYLNEHRLNYVRSLLEDSTESITEICLDAGFQSQRTFNRVFQNEYKMTPREYRNQFKQKYVVQQETE